MRLFYHCFHCFLLIFFDYNGQVSPTAGFIPQILKYLKDASQTRKIIDQKVAPGVR